MLLSLLLLFLLLLSSLLQVIIEHWATKSHVILDSTLKQGGQVLNRVESIEYSRATINVIVVIVIVVIVIVVIVIVFVVVTVIVVTVIVVIVIVVIVFVVVTVKFYGQSLLLLLLYTGHRIYIL